MRNEKPRLLDLFSGIGGFSLAFERAGFRTVGFAETDPYASAVLRKHWPSVTNHGNVRAVPVVRCDVIIGGFPCQPFSFAGQRRGADDDRYLWPAMLEVIKRCRPAWVLGENVPGIVSVEFDDMLVSLEAEGYSTQPFIVPACGVDARHRRDRVWILAYCAGGRCSQYNQKVRRLSKPNTRGKTLADSNEPKNGDQRNEPGAQTTDRVKLGRQIVSDSESEGAKNASNPNRCGREELDSPCFAAKQGEYSRSTDKGWSIWPVEPELGRVADGIPNRVDRIKCLGNSIVPQVAEIFARAIYAQIVK